jgi:hypothetical protein
MLAAADWRDLRTCDGNLSRPQTPRPVFEAACRELCARIWIELELLAQARSCPPQDLAMSTAILRLELVVLVDSCRSPQWRRILSAQQRDSLCALLTDVLAALYVDSEHLSSGIAAAQDRVLDELLPQPAADPLLADSASAYEPGQRSQPQPAPAVHELVSLIQAQAAARRAAAI